LNAAASSAFERAAESIESVVRDGNPEFNERGFYTVLAAAAYHRFPSVALNSLKKDVGRLWDVAG
jgi:hypothetical protein